MKRKYTEEDIKWAKEQMAKIRSMGLRITAKGIKDSGVYEEFCKRFNLFEPVPDYLAVWLRRIENPTLKKPYSISKTTAIFEKSTYIIVVAQNVMGFETQEEVKEFLSKSQILSGVKLFQSIPIEVKYEVIIG